MCSISIYRQLKINLHNILIKNTSYQNELKYWTNHEKRCKYPNGFNIGIQMIYYELEDH